MKSGKSKNILLLLFSLLLTLGISDWILRTNYRSFEGYYIYQPGLHQVFYPDSSVFIGITGESRFIANEIGIRSDSIPTDTTTKKILAIGGSTTECLYLDQSETWPSLLQQKLNKNDRYWVGNFSKPGLHSGHHVQQLKWMREQHELLNTKIIICLVGVNDLIHFLGSESFYLDTSQEKLFNWIFKYYGDDKKPFYKRSGFWKAFSAIRSRMKYKDNIQDQNGTVYTKWREQRKQAKKLITSLPDMEAAAAHYSQNITEMIKIGRENNIRILFITQPVLWNNQNNQPYNHLFWLGKKGRMDEACCGEYYSTEALAQGMEYFNQILKTTCARYKAECFDLASLLPKDTSIFYDDCHFNENGTNRVSDLVGNYLLGQKDALPVIKVERAVGQ